MADTNDHRRPDRNRSRSDQPTSDRSRALCIAGPCNWVRKDRGYFAQNGIEIIERVRSQSPEIYLKLCADLLPGDLAQTLDPGAEFRACDTAEDILQKLAEQDLAGNLEHAKWMYEGLLKIASEMAEPISEIGARRD